MKEYIKNLNNHLGDIPICFGHSGELDSIVEFLEYLCSEIKENGNILEIGFNSGHSAAVFLENADRNVVSFDICQTHWSGTKCCEKAKRYIDLTYPERHSLIEGDSKYTFPEFLLGNNEDVAAIFVDGDHSYDMASTDLNNALNLSKKGTIIIMDDVTQTAEMGHTVGPTKAWNEAIGFGRVLEVERCEFIDNSFREYIPVRGTAWGYVL